MPVCDICGKELKGHLKEHQAYKHNIGVFWHYCDIEKCVKKFKQKSNLKRHKQNIHYINVIWYKCGIKDCNYKCKYKGDLKKHKQNIHHIDITWHKCDIKGCKHKCKHKGDLKRHKQYIHGINIIWKKCDIKGCKYKCKQKSHLKIHKQNIHNLNVSWYKCSIKECNYKCKHKEKLNRHKQFVHDNGNNKCDFCEYNRNSHIYYKDAIGKHHICRKCYKRVTGKNSRIEVRWSNYIDKKFGTKYLLSNDESLRKNGGCQLYRPDKLYVGIHLVIISECDENQHFHDNGSYKCDEKRISYIYDEEGICGKTMVVIRWNPHKYKIPDGYKKKTIKQRLKLMVKLKKYLRKHPPKSKIHIFYMFYDNDNPRLSKNFPRTMIYGNRDIKKLKSECLD